MLSGFLDELLEQRIESAHDPRDGQESRDTRIDCQRMHLSVSSCNIARSVGFLAKGLHGLTN